MFQLRRDLGGRTGVESEVPQRPNQVVDHGVEGLVVDAQTTVRDLEGPTGEHRGAAESGRQECPLMCPQPRHVGAREVGRQRRIVQHSPVEQRNRWRDDGVAAEPLVQDPVAIDFDADGRMYVAEMRGFMPNLQGTGEDKPVGRIVVLEDTDDEITWDA